MGRRNYWRRWCLMICSKWAPFRSMRRAHTPIKVVDDLYALLSEFFSNFLYWCWALDGVAEESYWNCGWLISATAAIFLGDLPDFGRSERPPLFVEFIFKTVPCCLFFFTNFWIWDLLGAFRVAKCGQNRLLVCKNESFRRWFFYRISSGVHDLASECHVFKKLGRHPLT